MRPPAKQPAPEKKATASRARRDDGADQSEDAVANSLWTHLALRRPGQGMGSPPSDASGTTTGSQSSGGSASPIGLLLNAFGVPSNAVRLRTDADGASRALALRANAYTDGREIGFAPGIFNPSTASGRHTIAHEIAHVAQMRQSDGASTAVARQPSSPSEIPPSDSAMEREADRAADAVLRGEPPIVSPYSSRIARKGKVEPPAPPIGTYVPESGNKYRVNSLEITAWGSAMPRKLFHIHFRTVYPAATAEIEDDCYVGVNGAEWQGGDLSTLVTEHAALGLEIKPGLDKKIVAWMAEHHKEIKRVRPLKATYGTGGDGSGDGSGSGTGTGSGSGTGKTGSTGGATTTSAPKPPATTEDVNNHRVGLPPEFKKEDRDKLISVLKDIIGDIDPDAEPPDPLPEMAITSKTLEMLLQIADSADRAAIIARLKGDGAGNDSGQTLEEVIETAIATTSVEKGIKEMGLDLPKGDGGESPIVKRPVRGTIVNRSDRPVPGKTCEFEFKVFDDVDALRVPHVSIKWVGHLEGEPTKHTATSVTKYIPIDGHTAFFNDRYFDFSFPDPGIYVIEAIVVHNFFLPNRFTQRVEVLSEPALLDDLNKSAGKGFAQPGETQPHLFATGGLQGTQMGTVTRGDIEPGFKPLTIEDRLKQAGAERVQVEDLIKTYGKLKDPQSKAIVEWAKKYLETLDEAGVRLSKDKGMSPLGARGAFASRAQGVPSKGLNLLVYFSGKKGTYRLVLNDFTQVSEQENYRFDVSGSTVEQASEKAFLEQAEAYPPGSLSVTFQVYDEDTETLSTRYVQFTKVTDNIGKTIQHAIFHTAVDIAVNVAAAIMMVIPGLQPLGIAIAIAYNTAKTLVDIENASRKGTLTAGQLSLDLMMIALNVIPLAGRGAKLLTIAGKSFYAVETVVHAGNVLLITAQGMSEVSKLRNGVIKELAEVEGQIKAKEAVNPADPDLKDLRKRSEDLKTQGQQATFDVFSKLIATQAFMMVGQHLTMEYAARRFSVGELKGQGRFRHEEGKPAEYDYKTGQIVGDEVKVSPADLDRLQRTDIHNKALEGAVPDPAARQKVVEAIGDTPVEIKTNAETTAAVREDGKPTLKVAEGAAPDVIVTEAAKLKSLPPDPAAKAQPAKKPAETFENITEKAAAEKKAAAAKESPKASEPAKPIEELPATKEGLEAKAEADLQLEARARQAYKDAVAQAKKDGRTFKGGDEASFIQQYKDGKVYDLTRGKGGKGGWVNAEGKPKLPPEKFPPGTKPDMAFERLAGAESTSSFKPYMEMLKKLNLADQPKIVKEIEPLLGKGDVTVDKVRHGLKELHRQEVLDAMWKDASGTALDAKASHARMLEITKDLHPADKGTLAEDWLQAHRQKRDPAAKDAPQQVVVRAKDQPAMKGDRRLDRIDGEAVGEVKSGDGYLKPSEKEELVDHLALVGEQGAKINANGKSVTVKTVEWTFLSPEGAKKNANWMVEQLKVSDKLSFEVFNSTGESKVFSQADVTGNNTGKLHEFLGIPTKP